MTTPVNMLASNAFNLETLHANETRMRKEVPAHILNRQEYLNEMAYARELFCARFTWEVSTDAADTIPSTYIEGMLFDYGMLAFFYDANYGWLLLPATSKLLNVYGQPEEVEVFYPSLSTGTVSKTLSRHECVILRDNPNFLRPSSTASFYAHKIADAYRTSEVYLNGMKKPIIIATDFKSKTSKADFINKIESNEKYILVDLSQTDGLSPPILQQNTTHNSEDLRGIMTHRKSLFHELCTRLGVTTPATVKAAQVTEDEVNKNDVIANILIGQALECRQKANDEILELSGGDVALSCTLNEALDHPTNENTEGNEDV